ncbi:MAG: hypothetical protein ACE5RN_07640 [Nitrosopumilaceae archaeon]
MNKLLSLITFSALLLVPAGIQNAYACSTHGSTFGNDITNWLVTSGSAAGEFQLRFKNFNTLAYSGGEMCSCVIEVLNGWTIQSAELVLAGTNTPISTFPTFLPDSVLTLALESNPLFPTSADSKLVALKNTISVSSSGGQAVDLVFNAVIPGATESEIIEALEGKLLAVGLLNSQGTGFEPDHFQILNIILAIVGGESIPIETTSLILAGAQSFSWMIPVVLSGIGIGLFVFRKPKNS